MLCETVLKRLDVEDGRITKSEFNALFAIIVRAKGSGTVPINRPFGIVPELVFEKRMADKGELCPNS